MKTPSISMAKAFNNPYVLGFLLGELALLSSFLLTKITDSNLTWAIFGIAIIVPLAIGWAYMRRGGVTVSDGIKVSIVGGVSFIVSAWIAIKLAPVSAYAIRDEWDLISPYFNSLTRGVSFSILLAILAFLAPRKSQGLK